MLGLLPPDLLDQVLGQLWLDELHVASGACRTLRTYFQAACGEMRVLGPGQLRSARATRAALRQAEEPIEYCFPFGFMKVDVIGGQIRIVHASSSGLRCSGFTPSKLHGTPALQCTHAQEPVACTFFHKRLGWLAVVATDEALLVIDERGRLQQVRLYPPWVVGARGLRCKLAQEFVQFAGEDNTETVRLVEYPLLH